ncbi:MAG: TonB-dependent receptor, partial [Pseudomonadota bacterium]
MKRSALLATLAGTTSLTSVFCGAALAQQSAPDTIVVTAQKREQALEDVPVSVAVIDGEFIDRQNIQDLTDYLDLVPGLTGETAGASGDGISVRIRGIGALGGNTNTFGVYVDGFDTTGATTALAGGRLVDPERVEVLRGPQGTAFGRNVVAGAISITSLTPTTDEFKGRISLDAGNNGVLGVRGRVNIPVSDTTAVLLSSFYDRTNGFVDNLTLSGSSEDEQENYGFRASVQTDPTDALSIKASLSYERLSQQLQSEVPDNNPGGTVAFFVDLINAGGNPLFSGDDIASPLAEFFPDQGIFAETDTPEMNFRENMIGTLNVTYDFGDHSLVWVSGASYSEQENEGDGDDSSLNNVIVEGASETLFASTELRFQNNGDDRLDYVGGVFASYSNANSFARSVAGETIQLTTLIPESVLGPAVAALVPNPYFTVPTPLGGTLAENNSSSDTLGLAIFADVDFEITDRWNILVGGRYNYDEESQTVENLIDIQDVSFFGLGLLPFAPSTAFPDATDEVDFDQFTWRASTVYELADAVNVYATVSTGYRPGGLQL